MTPHLILPQFIYRAMLAHARAEYPREACGLLRGRAGRVTDFLPARNVARNPQMDYEVDAASLLRALAWEDEGDELIAIYHSHPTSPARPSAVDAGRAFYPDSVYLIISLQNPDAPQLHGYLLRPEAVFRDDAARRLQQDVSFQQVRPGLWAHLFSGDAPLADNLRPGASDPIAFYLIFEKPAPHRPPPVRLISVQPASISIQI